MGADYMSMMLPRCTGDNRITTPELGLGGDWGEVVDAWFAAVAEDPVSANESLREVDYLWEGYGDGILSDGSVLDFENNAIAGPFREIISSTLTAAVKAFNESPRQWAYHQYGAVTFHVTGGLSWGDNPSEEFDAITELFALDINNVLYKSLGFIEPVMCVQGESVKLDVVIT